MRGETESETECETETESIACNEVWLTIHANPADLHGSLPNF